MRHVFGELTICGDHGTLSRHAATIITESARAAVDEHGRFAICLSGGTTPRATYSLLATKPFRDELPWRSAHVFWGDGRCIPVDDPNNHFRMATDLFLSKVPIPPENIHRMRGESDDPAQAAQEYEGLLRAFFALGPKDRPSFDLILLGMGADGHTASLFPGTDGLNESERLVVAHYVPKLGAHRLTLTLPVLNAARRVLFLVSGEGKAVALRSVLQNGDSEPALPAQMIRASDTTVRWLVDEAAASGLADELRFAGRGQ